MPDRSETPGLAAIRKRISGAERDVSQVVRDGFGAGATANEVMQVVLAATAEVAEDDEWRRSLRERLRMHGLNEIVRVLRADPAKAEEFANFMRERAEEGIVEKAGAAAETQATGGQVSIRGATERAALAAHECLAHPDCGPVTALGQSGHGHHSDVTGLWCWHFTDSWVGGGPLDPPPPDGSDAAQRRAQGCIDGDPSIHKTYPSAGPREGYWSDDFAVASGLTKKESPAIASDSSSEVWRTRGAADAPIALRAISRAIFDEPHLGKPCAAAIIEAYGQDMKRIGPNVASVHNSEARVKLLSSFVADANRTEWMGAFLSAPPDYMAQYRAGFIEALNEQMANWAARPTKPPLNAKLVAEEDRWQRALIMGDAATMDDLRQRFLMKGGVGAKERRGWRRFLPEGRG